LNVGIIGAGGIARKLHLPALAQIDEITVSHIAGRKPSRLTMLCEEFDIPKWCTDYRSILADDTVEGVIIALPHPLHVPVGLEALAAGKHVLMQKPLCGNMAESNAFVKAVESGDRCVLALPNYGTDVNAARSVVKSGSVGRLSSAHCRVSHGGPEVYYAEIRDYFGEEGNELWFFQSGEAAVGALFDMGVYAVSVLVAIMGSVVSVMGQIATFDKPTTLEDTATLILRFANGAIGTAETGWCDPARSFQYSIHGTSGKLTNSGPGGTGLTHWTPGSYTREDVPAVPIEIDLSNFGSTDVHLQWLDCIHERRQPELSNARTARHITEILLAGLESSRTGKLVSVDSTM
jgi:predicted dehydrogenase